MNLPEAYLADTWASGEDNGDVLKVKTIDLEKERQVVLAQQKVMMDLLNELERCIGWSSVMYFESRADPDKTPVSYFESQLDHLQSLREKVHKVLEGKKEYDYGMM